jgi:hypothetical protein
MHIWAGPNEQELLHDCQDLPLSAPLLRLLKHRQNPPGLQFSRHKRPHRRPSAYLRSVSIHRVAVPIHLHPSSPYPEGFERTSSGPLTRTLASTTLVPFFAVATLYFLSSCRRCLFSSTAPPVAHCSRSVLNRSCKHGLLVGLPSPRACLSSFLRCLHLW